MLRSVGQFYSPPSLGNAMFSTSDFLAWLPPDVAAQLRLGAVGALGVRTVVAPGSNTDAWPASVELSWPATPQGSGLRQVLTLYIQSECPRQLGSATAPDLALEDTRQVAYGLGWRVTLQTSNRGQLFAHPAWPAGLL